MTLGVLATAKKSPSIRRVVLTSSTAAGLIVVPDVERAPVDETTWNEESKVNARKDNPDLFDVYCATKTEGEQAAWRWVEEEKVRVSYAELRDCRSLTTFALSLTLNSTRFFQTPLLVLRSTPARTSSSF